jgi:hypothetical protein
VVKVGRIEGDIDKLMLIDAAFPKKNQSLSGHRNRRKGGKSGYTGVYRYRDRCKRVSIWRAIISIKGRQRFLGAYKTKKEAALAHDKAARILYGADAVTNFPG